MLTCILETLDHARKFVDVKTAEAVMRTRLVKPAELDDNGRLPGSDEFLYRLYTRQWCRDGIAYYKEAWPNERC